MVDIITLNGKAEIFWEKNPEKVFVLKGAEDRISLSSGQLNDKLIIRRLSTSNDENKLASTEDQGFIFYSKYYTKDYYINFNEIDYGKSVEVFYKETDLPVYLYSKIGNCENDINIALTFKDLDINDKGKFYSPPLNIKTAIVKEKTIYKVKQDPDLKPKISKEAIGIYDPAFKTAQIYLTKETINEYNIQILDIPTLYLSIEKSNSFIQKNNNQFSIEA